MVRHGDLPRITERNGVRRVRHPGLRPGAPPTVVDFVHSSLCSCGHHAYLYLPRDTCALGILAGLSSFLSGLTEYPWYCMACILCHFGSFESSKHYHFKDKNIVSKWLSFPQTVRVHQSPLDFKTNVLAVVLSVWLQVFLKSFHSISQ